MDWLTGVEEDKLRSYLLSNNSLNTDFYMCGHTNNRNNNNWYNNKHSLTTLVTGIGWPEENNNERPEMHCYSLYEINPKSNSIEIIMRRSNDDQQFINDFSAYTSDVNSNRGRISYPIRSSVTQSFINISRSKANDPLRLYLNKGLIDLISKVSNSLSKFSLEISARLEIVKSDFLNNIEDEQENICIKEYFLGMRSNENVKNASIIFDKGKEMIYESFDGYLRRICTIFLDVVFSEFINNKDELVRTHFRYFDFKDNYKKICSNIIKLDEVEDELKIDIGANNELLDMEWGQLIEKAFEIEKSLIYSVNKVYTSEKISDRWDDFITIIPTMECNRINIGRSKIKYRPYITFGITGRLEKFTDMLYILDFLNINNIIGDIISNFMECFQIDLKDFIEHFLMRE